MGNARSYTDVDPPVMDGIRYSNPRSRVTREPRRELPGFAAVQRGYPANVPDAYQEQLDRLGNGLADMCNLVADALDNATRALLRADLQLAEQVITDDARIDQLRTTAEEQAFTLLELQAPVATDLRIVVSGLHAAGDIERMTQARRHDRGAVAPPRTVAEHHPERAVDADMEDRSAIDMRLEMLQRPAIERAPLAEIELGVEGMELPHSRFMQV